MADNGNPIGTDLRSAQQAIAAMMAPSEEDTAAEGDAPELEEEGFAAEYEGEELEYEAEPEDEDQQDADLEGEQNETMIRIVENGVEKFVTAEEAAKGYQRQQDYSRKTAELAEQRRALEAYAAEVEAERARYAQLVPALIERLEQQQQQAEPDWDTLYAKDPAQATRLERQWNKAKEERAAQLEAARQEQARLAYVQQQQTEAQRQAILQQQQQRLVEVIPAWKDQKIAAKEAAELRSYLIAGGFTEADVAGIVNADVVAMARKAMLYDKGRKVITEKAKAPQGSPKTLKAGSRGTQPRKAGAVEQAQQRLARSGRVSDAAAVLKNLL